MPLSRKQAVTSISVVYLVILTAIAGYAMSRTNDLSIPIPSILSGFTTALPIVSGLLLEIGYDATRRQERRRRLPRGDTPRPPFVIVVNTIIFIYSTVVITLLGTHVGPPSGLNCGLRERWQNLYHRKDSQSIRSIQDAFACCGLQNPLDMAWPFPDRSHKPTACREAFGRDNGCLGAWKQEERNMAGLLMGVVGLVFIWQITIVTVPTKKDSWLHRVVPERISQLIADEDSNDNRPRRAIDYLPTANNRYYDNVEEVGDEEAETQPRRHTIEGVGQQVRNALVGGNNEEEEEASHPAVENEWART